MSKFVNLEQIKVLANKVKSEDAALGTKLETVTTKVDNLASPPAARPTSSKASRSTALPSPSPTRWLTS